MKPSISVCMICRDEEHTISRCLAAVEPLVQEIIVVDTGSKDRTIERAANFTDQLFNFSWNNDFSAARNFSVSRATGEWLLFLDADEVLYHDDMRQLVELISSDDSGQDVAFTGIIVDLYEFEVDYNRVPYYRHIPRPPMMVVSTGKLMLVRNGPDIRYIGRIHESLDFSRRRNADIRPGIRCAHFRDRRRKPARHQEFFELEQEALVAEPKNSNAHLNALNTFLLRGWRNAFCVGVARIAYVDPRFRQHFHELLVEVEAAGWHPEAKCLKDLLAGTTPSQPNLYG